MHRIRAADALNLAQPDQQRPVELDPAQGGGLKKRYKLVLLGSRVSYNLEVEFRY